METKIGPDSVTLSFADPYTAPALLAYAYAAQEDGNLKAYEAMIEKAREIRGRRLDQLGPVREVVSAADGTRTFVRDGFGPEPEQDRAQPAIVADNVVVAPVDPEVVPAEVAVSEHPEPGAIVNASPTEHEPHSPNDWREQGVDPEPDTHKPEELTAFHSPDDLGEESWELHAPKEQEPEPEPQKPAPARRSRSKSGGVR